MNNVEKYAENLAEALADVVVAALKSRGFHPSERFVEQLNELIRNSIGLA